MPAASAGTLNVTLTMLDQMNLGVGDVFSLLGDSVYDVGMNVTDYAVADAPEMEGLDVPLLALTADEARAMVNAARPMVADIFAEHFNCHLLAIAPYPPQVVFCNAEIGSLDDLKGKKVRASGRMTAKFLEALEAEGVNVSFAEVPGALQKGVVDCAVTGEGRAIQRAGGKCLPICCRAPWVGWDSVVTAMNIDKWNSLGAKAQALITSEIAANFETSAWAIAQGVLVNDVACLTGNMAIVHQVMSIP